MGNLDVALLFGGRSGEHEVSLMSARSVLESLDPERYRVVQVGITKSGQWWMGEQALSRFESESTEGLQPVTMLPAPGNHHLYGLNGEAGLEIAADLDIVFPMLHGTYGEDGTLQGMLEMAEIPYVGAGVLASAVAMDKGLFKALMQSLGLPVLDFIVVTSVEVEVDADLVLDRAERIAGYPLFTKPANLGSSVGVSKVRNRSDLLEGVMGALEFDRRVVIERGIDAREIEVSVLGNENPIASVPGEIIPSDEFYSYRAKYIDGASELIIPADLDPQTTEQARDWSVQAYQSIDGAGMARVDFLLERETGQLFINEINTIPGFTEISMYPKLWEVSGIPYPELMDRLIDLALERHQQRSALVRDYRGGS